MGAPGKEDPPTRSIVLVAPRDPDAELVLDRLGGREERTDVRRCTTVEAGLEAAREESADVLLFAITDSPDAVLEDIRRAAASDPDVPIALIGEDLDPVVAGRAVEAGADRVMEDAELTERVLDRALELAGARHRGRKADLAEAHLTRAMLDSLPEHVAVLDARGEILAVNDAWLSFARSEGGDPRGYEGDNYLRVTEAAAERGIEDAGEVLEGIHGILAGERERFSLEYPCHSPEKKRWFRVEVAPLKADHLRGVVVSHIDITERRLAEEELEARRRSLAEVFEGAPSYIAVLRGPDHVFEMANPTYREMVGHRDLIGRPAREVFPEVEAQGYFEILDRVYRTGEPYHGQEQPIEIRGPDGELQHRYRNFVYQPRWESEEVVGIIAHGVDVTAQVEARREAEQAEEKWATVIDLAPTGITISEGDTGRLLTVNQAAATILGWSPEAMIGSSAYDLDFWVDVAERDRLVRRVRSEGIVRDAEVRLQTRTGERKLVQASVRKLSSAGEHNLLWTFHDVSEQKRLEEELRHQALHDSLTGLANRTLFSDRLEQALARSERRGQLVGLLMLDLDRFKQINDHLGHVAGDRVLEEVGRRLEREIREEDTAARLGGDEFAVLLPELEDESGLLNVRDRLLQALGEPFRIKGEVVSVDATMGGVIHAARESDSTVRVEEPDDLVRYVDLALSRAKKPAGPTFLMFRPEEDAESAAFLGREQELRRAIREEEFELLYQPIVRLDDGEIWGAEPLARWQHPDRGRLPPSEFIPLAEETGLIHDLGELLLREICGEVGRWPAGPDGRLLRVTPNLSGRQFDSDRILGVLSDIAAEEALDPSRCWFEITESAVTRATRRVEELRELGFGVLVDDFGTGFSSFHYLRDLSLDGLKIDMSFVQALQGDATNRALVETMVTMGRTMRMTVVGEGVETGRQRDALEEFGCPLAQGYLFARPMPLSELRDLLAGRQEDA